jgi:5-methylthioadenosine/S-adenosylhomocysteine deaminase
MKLASGVAPLDDFLRAGIRVGLGTDGGASNNDLDMFAELDFTAKLHKVIRRDPAAMAAGIVLRLGTIGGATAIGLADRIGSLEPGKAADVIVLDTSSPRMVPLYDPVSHVVYAVNGGDVRDVWIGGRAVVKDRCLLTLDLEDTIARVARLAAGVGGRSTR